MLNVNRASSKVGTSRLVTVTAGQVGVRKGGQGDRREWCYLGPGRSAL